MLEGEPPEEEDEEEGEEDDEGDGAARFSFAATLEEGVVAVEEVVGTAAAAEEEVSLSDPAGAGAGAAPPPTTWLDAPQLDGSWIVAGWVVCIGLHPGKALSAIPERPISSAGETMGLMVHLFMASWVWYPSTPGPATPKQASEARPVFLVGSLPPSAMAQVFIACCNAPGFQPLKKSICMEYPVGSPSAKTHGGLLGSL